MTSLLLLDFFNNATALLLFGLSRAFCLLVLLLFSTACGNLLNKFSDLPSRHPLAFFALRDCFVLWLISPASYSAMLLIICSTSLFASGKSQNTISTSDSNNLLVKATFLLNLSSFATIRMEPVFLHTSKTSVSLGLSDLRPLSVSIYSATGFLSFR